MEIETKFSELHYVQAQVLLAICRDCFLGKIGHNFKTKTSKLRPKTSILTELHVPSYV